MLRQDFSRKLRKFFDIELQILFTIDLETEAILPILFRFEIERIYAFLCAPKKINISVYIICKKN
jgi:hypothetical protein